MRLKLLLLVDCGAVVNSTIDGPYILQLFRFNQCIVLYAIEKSVFMDLSYVEMLC
jgi:hypothetical protein